MLEFDCSGTMGAQSARPRTDSLVNRCRFRLGPRTFGETNPRPQSESIKSSDVGYGREIRSYTTVKVDGQARIAPDRRREQRLFPSLKTSVTKSGARVGKSQAHNRPFHAQKECA
jgi:hypothetical protein